MYRFWIFRDISRFKYGFSCYFGSALSPAKGPSRYYKGAIGRAQLLCAAHQVGKRRWGERGTEAQTGGHMDALNTWFSWCKKACTTANGSSTSLMMNLASTEDPRLWSHIRGLATRTWGCATRTWRRFELHHLHCWGWKEGKWRKQNTDLKNNIFLKEYLIELKLRIINDTWTKRDVHMELTRRTVNGNIRLKVSGVQDLDMEWKYLDMK